MEAKKIVAFAKSKGYDGALFLNEWRGYTCYEPIFEGEETAYVGLPLIIMVKGDEIRMSSSDEAMQHLNKFSKGAAR